MPMQNGNPIDYLFLNVRVNLEVKNSNCSPIMASEEITATRTLRQSSTFESSAHIKGQYLFPFKLSWNIRNNGRKFYGTLIFSIKTLFSSEIYDCAVLMFLFAAAPRFAFKFRLFRSDPPCAISRQIILRHILMSAAQKHCGCVFQPSTTTSTLTYDAWWWSNSPPEFWQSICEIIAAKSVVYPGHNISIILRNLPPFYWQPIKLQNT